MASNFRIWTIGLLVLVIISLGISTFAVVFAMQSKDEQNSSNAPLVRKDRIDAQQSPSASPKMERPLRNRAQRNNRAAQITVNKFKDEPKGKKEKADRKKIGKSKGKITPNKSKKTYAKKINIQKKKTQSLSDLVTAGKLTQIQADEKLALLTKKYKSMVDAGKLTREQADKKLALHK